MYNTGVEIPRVSFSALSYSGIPVNSFFMGFDSDNLGKLSKLDNTGTVTVIEGGGSGGGISLTDLSVNAPLTYNNITGVFNIGQSSGSTSGFLSLTDWNTFNNKQGALTLTTTGSSGAATLVGNTLNIPQYSGGGGGGISLTSLSANAPITYNNTNGVFSINQANGSTNGYLSSTDWTTFNSKQGAITLTTTGTSGAATLVGNTLNIPQYSGGGGGLSGSGSFPRMAMWSTSNTLQNSAVRNVSDRLGVNADPIPGVCMYLQTGTSHNFGLSIETLNTTTNTVIEARAITAATNDNRGIYIRAENGSEDNIGIESITEGVGAASKTYGIRSSATGGFENNGISISSTGIGGTSSAYGINSLVSDGQTSYGIYSLVQTSIANSDNVGGYFSVNQSGPITTNTAIGIVSKVFPTGPRLSSNAYFAQFTKHGVSSTNTVVCCDNSSGYADWGKVTSSYTTGASGTFTSADGKTITVTNGLITSIV